MAAPDIDPSLLRALVAVADTGSVSAAARQLALTQPAVSQKLRRLADALGVTLFIRAGRRVELTRQGELVLGYARGLLRLQSEMAIRVAGPEVAGRVRLGTPDLYAAYLMPAVLEGFAQLFPEVQIELRCRLSQDLLVDMDNDLIDIALVTRQPRTPGGGLVRREPLVWIGRPDLGIHRRDPLPLAMLPTGNLYRDIALAALESAGRAARVVSESTSIGGLYAAVRGGLAISVVARCAVEHDIEILGRDHGMPALDQVDLMLYQQAAKTSDTHKTNEATRALARFIMERLSPGGPPN